MSHKNQYRSRKRKFTGNQYRNKRSSIDSQAKKDTTVASNIELKTASASKFEDLKDNFLENSGNCDEIFGHRIFDVTTLLSVFAVLCCPVCVCLHDELSLTEDSRICSKKAKVPDAASNAHVCCNHVGSASSMETVGAYRKFERSENHRKLQYTDYYGDGNPKAYESVKNMYAPNTVNKLECIGHVQKMVGSHLRKF
ncbi:uncharacterized protein TNCV_2484401 [Trichonephila clavipes]|uniref:Mutator-like transposase domain-containing protein n=1 Tax=Trichonephila clavipes TaxID=2585209 RepID=A0A8X7BAT5_TRICX|nr:uncharacterized protein TNCV_2484401 [Trichonephila clavipes]